MDLSIEADRPGPDSARGSVREVFELAYPVILTQLSTTAMGAVDSAMVGRLGATQLAAVGFGSIWLWTIFSLFYGSASGVQTFVSQAHGAAKPRECGAWLWQACYALIPAALLVGGALALLIGPALRLLDPSEGLQQASREYMLGRMLGDVAFVASMVAISFFRGLGDTRTPLYITLVANLINAVLDYGLIFGTMGLPAWGVAGAGIATSVSQVVAAIILFAALRRPALMRRFRTRVAAPTPSAIGRFLRTGAPIGGGWFLDMMAFALFTTLVARMGDETMAANQALIILLSFSFMQAVGISVATSILVGRYVGAGMKHAARRSLRSGLVLGATLSTIIAVLLLAIPMPLLRIFTDESSVLEIGMPLMTLCALFQFFDNAAIVTEGALRGAGDTRWPFVVQTVLSWGLFLPLAYTLAIVLGYGLEGAWVAELTYIGLLAVLVMWRFNSGAWERIRI